MDAAVRDLVAQKSPHLEVLSDGRVKCSLNGHVMPATLQAVQSFVSGSKFRRLEKGAQEKAGFAKYEPFIIQSKNKLEKLYCALTCMLINKSEDSLRKHMKGRAFIKAKGEFENDKLELMEEPDFEDSDEASQSQSDAAKADELLENLEDMDLQIEPSLEATQASSPAQVNYAEMEKKAKRPLQKDATKPSAYIGLRGRPDGSGKRSQKKKIPVKRKEEERQAKDKGKEEKPNGLARAPKKTAGRVSIEAPEKRQKAQREKQHKVDKAPEHRKEKRRQSVSNDEPIKRQKKA